MYSLQQQIQLNVKMFRNKVAFVKRVHCIIIIIIILIIIISSSSSSSSILINIIIMIVAKHEETALAFIFEVFIIY